MLRVAMVTTHPIQYQVPWLQRLSAQPGVELDVFFAMVPSGQEQGREFGVAFDWDIPLLDGYRHTVMANLARQPSLTAFNGCDTPQIFKEIRPGRFDAVIVNGWGSKTCVQALGASKRSGIPCIVRGEANGLRRRPAWKRGVHRLLLRQYAAHLAIGKANRDYYRDRGVPEARIFHTPYCVDNERFSRLADGWLDREGRAGLCERFGLDPSLPTFLFSGKFVDKKRPMDLVEAIAAISASGVCAQALMVGDGPLGPELRERSAGLPIHFSGFLNQSEIPAAYAVSNCLVLPSDSGETWGLVVNEAMACALPAIVSDQVGCAADLLRTDESGFVFPCSDVESLAKSIASAAKGSGRLRKQGGAAKSLVHSQYNFEIVVEGVVAALRSVTGITN